MELLQALGRRRAEVLLYAWCPLLIWEIGSSGHLDSAAMAFIALALLARLRQQPIATGLFLGAAILIKFYPLVLFPALWQRKDVKMPSTIVGLAAFSYACYASVGKLVFGFLGGYVQEEGIADRYTIFSVGTGAAYSGPATRLCHSLSLLLAVAFAALALWSWKAGNPNPDFSEPDSGYGLSSAGTGRISSGRAVSLVCDDAGILTSLSVVRGMADSVWSAASESPGLHLHARTVLSLRHFSWRRDSGVAISAELHSLRGSLLASVFELVIRRWIRTIVTARQRLA